MGGNAEDGVTVGKTALEGWRVKVPVRSQMGRQGHQEVTYTDNPRVVVEEKAPPVCVCYLSKHTWDGIRKKVRVSSGASKGYRVRSVWLLVWSPLPPKSKFLMMFLSFLKHRS